MSEIYEGGQLITDSLSWLIHNLLILFDSESTQNSPDLAIGCSTAHALPA